MKRLFLLFLVLAIVFTMASCNALRGDQGEQGLPGKDGVGISSITKVSTSGNIDMYKISYTNGIDTFFTVTNGTNGSNGADGKDGKDGVSITNVSVNGDGECIVSMSNDSSINIGKIVGAPGKDGTNGADGKEGVGIANVAINDDNLVMTLTNGTVIDLGNVKGANGKDGQDGVPGQNGSDGKDGVDGEDGDDGVSVTKAEINTNGDLVFAFSDGKVVNVGSVVGAPGKDGTNGTPGQNGTDGVGISNVTLNDGNLVITLTNGSVIDLGNIKGEDGKDGTDGVDGITPTFKIENGILMVSYNNGLTWALLGNIQGANGEDGLDGKDGQDGAPGKDGAEGKDGKDGIDGVTPTFKIENDNLMVSYDNGATWTLVGKIKGEDGAQGNAGLGIKSAKIDEFGCLILLLTDGSEVNCGSLYCSHNFGEWISELEATCTSAGLNKHICSICGFTEFEITVLLAHSYSSTIVSPSCTTDGYTVYRCECGNTYTADYIEAQGHLFTNWLPIAMTKEGEVSFSNCDICGESRCSVEYKPSLNYVLNDRGDAYIIADIGYCEDEDIVIPSTYMNLPVVEIGASAFNGCDNITSIVLPDTITIIGNNAFRDCTSLGNIRLPDNLAIIGDYAFSNCRQFTEISVPNTVDQIGLSAFRGCDNLVSMTLPFVGQKRDASDYNATLGYIFGYTTANNTSNVGSYSTSFVNYPCSQVSGAVWQYSCYDYNGFNSSYYYLQSYFYYIPSSLRSITITDAYKISSAAFNGCENLVEICLNDGVTQIDAYAFRGCNGIICFEVPGDIISIGRYAFSNCSSLECVKFGDRNSSISIEAYAFNKCVSLTDLDFSDNDYTISSNVFSGCDLLSDIKFGDGDVTLQSNAICNECSIESVIFGEGNVTVAPSAFNSQKITDVVFGQGTTLIEAEAFYKCESLTSVTLGNDTVSIGSRAFCGCKSLTIFEVPPSVTTIGEAAFNGCVNLERITLPFVGESREATSYKAVLGYIFGFTTYYTSSNTSSSNSSSFTNLNPSNVSGAVWQFSCYNLYYSSQKYCLNGYYYYIPSSLREITITNQTVIPDAAFNGCSNLSKIVLCEGVTEIGKYAFQNCSTIEKIEIQNTVTKIGNNAFYGCSNLKDVYITDIAAWCGIDFSTSSSTPFYYADNLHLVEGEDVILVTEIVIPNNVTSIGAYAFYNHSSLTSVIISNSVESIGSYAFKNCSTLTSIVIPDTVVSVGSSAFSGCSSLESMTIPFVGESRKAEDDTYQYPFGYIFGTSSYTGGSATTQNYYGSSTSSTTSQTYYIPTSLKSVTVTGGNILRGAFYNCSSLTSIVIPDGATSIGNSAFYNCSSLTSIVIPDSATSIENSAFYNCSSLTSIVIPDSMTSIGDSAFYGCSSLTNIVVPDNVTSIGLGAFRNCNNLVSITLPFVGKSRDAEAYEATIGYIFGYKTDYAYSSDRSSATSSQTFVNDHIPGGGSGTTWQYSCMNYYYSGASSKPYCLRGYFYYIPSSLSEVVITDATKISDAAFNGCAGLTSVMLNEGITSMGAYAFQNCTSLTIYFEDSIQPDGWNVDWNSSNCPVVWGYSR